VRLAHQFAMESEHITADCIEATEFPDLVTQYRVQAVPKTVINEEYSLEGSLPESYFLDTVLKSVQPSDEREEE
jgi:predicted DsbA family dithiol-disulfide isomerase